MHRCSNSNLYVYLRIQVSATICPLGNFTVTVYLLVSNINNIFE